MSMAPNPIVSDGPARVLLSEHARFRSAERDVDRDIVQELSTARMADFKVDERSGNLVFKVGNSRVVAKRVGGQEFIILSLFADDQKPV